MHRKDRARSFLRTMSRAWGARYCGRAFVWIKTKAKTTSPIIHREDDLHAS
jgi:hypothetical protein